MAMRWEKVQVSGVGGGPGVRWGHTCNAIGGGKLLYVFGGYGKDQCQTNQVHVFDTVNMFWSEPDVKGTPPTPRDSHSCTTVGDNLFVFGGTDGRRPLNDLQVFQTSSNTWVVPCVRGDAPEPREGHSAALIGKRLFIFGGCGKYENSEIYYDDLYILNTETFVWKRVLPSGIPPSKRDSHTCVSWNNKIIVVGGEDSFNYYLSDVHILDADTLVWCKLNTTGQLLPPRGGHTTISLGKNLFVFGGFSDEQNLYSDVYMLDIETGAWIKVAAMGEGPSGRFSMAGESLDPQMEGVLVFIGGCNKNLEALDDMYYLHTGFSRDIDRDDRRNEKLSLRKQLKLKCQEQTTGTPGCEKVSYGAEHEHDTNIYQPMPISTYMPAGRQNFYLNEFQTPVGKRTFQAKVFKSFPDGYTIETIIDGKPLRGVLFSNKATSTSMGVDNFDSKMEAMKIDDPNVHVDHNTGMGSEKPLQHDAIVVGQADVVGHDAEGAKNPDAGNDMGIATTETKNPDAESSIPQEVPVASEMQPVPAGDAGSDAAAINQLLPDVEMHDVYVPAPIEDQTLP
ncbi:tip elongation aberrant protein 1-like [Salvia miltiorrhiza]|uniref:tip elongation aberrant protein 1-like n=1 Tax=Salvia miltiorrhiza TaxID=226208 RepID=UPI0025ABBC6B|nr:tip elongation aberrant protein 1-like [Salvia miltiorrhiza]